MNDKCCCGTVKLSTATSICLMLSLIQAILGLFWNIQLLLLFDEKEVFNFLKLLINVQHISDFEVLHGFTLASIGLNSFWILFGLLAARGNVTLSHNMLAPWIMITYIITFFDFGSSVYLSIKIQTCIAENPYLYDPTNGHATATLTYLTLLLFFSRCGLMWFVNIYLAHTVGKRANEINHNHSALILYILSHLTRPRSWCQESPRMNRNCDPPPEYINSYPSFLPKYILERTRDNGTSWSISNDAIGSMNGFSNPCYGAAAPINGRMAFSVEDLPRIMTQDPPPYQQQTSVERNTPILP